MPSAPFRAQIDRRQLASLLKRLDAERMATPIKDGMRDGLGEVIQEVQRIIQPARDTGQTGAGYKLDLRGSNLHTIQGRVYNPLISASVLEEGRRPGRMPPVDVIWDWARRKLGNVDRGVAFVIARSIGRTGSPRRRRGGSVQPYHQLEMAAAAKVNAFRDGIIRRIQRAL